MDKITIEQKSHELALLVASKNPNASCIIDDYIKAYNEAYNQLSELKSIKVEKIVNNM